MGIDADDERFVEALHRHVIRPYHRSIMKEFYEFLLGQPEMRPFLEDSETLARLEHAQTDYLLDFGRDCDTTRYFDDRLRIGLVHLRIGLPLHLYLAAYRHLQSLLLSRLDEVAVSDNATRIGCAGAIVKITMLDLSLAVDAYSGSQVRNLSESIVELEDEKQSLQSRLMYDSLTDVYSRTYVLEALADRLAEFRRDEKPLAVALLDLDDFKAINDTWGHQVGDRVLREAAAAIQASTREHDVLGRYGGEEFLLVLSGTTGELAVAIAERIRTGLGRHRFRVEGRELGATVSIGVTAAERGDSVADLIGRADRAVYQAKSEGRNRTVLLAAKPAPELIG